MSECNVVSISGGKDSTATALLALERGATNLSLIFADTGHEHQVTYDYVDYLEQRIGLPIRRVRADFSARIANKRLVVQEKWRRDGVSESQIERALAVLQPTGNPFLDLCLWKGRFPSTRRRFCSEHLKHIPLDNAMDELLERYDEVVSWQGVRRDESASRAKLAEEEDHPTKQGLVWYRPILDWTVADVFAMSAKFGVKNNPLYREGMGRVGCMPCIHATKGEVFEIARRFPEELARLAEWEKLVGEAAKRGASTFFDARVTQRVLGLPPITKDNLHAVSAETHGVAAYVQWSKTKRGGTEPDLIKLVELETAPTCKSIYGLCE